MNLDQFKQLPIVGILRAGADVPIESVVAAVAEAGLRTMEITMNTPGAPGLIRRAIAAAGGEMAIGAGTVLDMQDLENAVDAGASFVVMPTLVRDVVTECVRREMPVFPGALTPQEISDAWNAGATMVKVFPAKFFGPSYFKEIKGPFGDVALLACGGVDRGNLAEFFANGASAVAFGGSVFRPEWLARSQTRDIADAVRALIDAYRDHCQNGPTAA